MAFRSLLSAAVLASVLSPIAAVAPAAAETVQVGPRPYYLVQDMDAGPLKDKLSSCDVGTFHKTDFSIGHRGAALMFPEHTRQSYRAAARMGAGVIECDVAFTKDRELVCRHSQCDLHTTTDILAHPNLAAKCTEPFSPADPATGKKASATCCTSDITLAEFRTLNGKMDGANPDATTVEAYMAGTPGFRTDLYATRGTLMSHKDSIALFKQLGVKFTPELKTPSVAMPYEGDYSQEDYAAQMIEDYIAAGVDPSDVFAQSFNEADIYFWLKAYPAFGKQAVYLDDRDEEPNTTFKVDDPATWKPSMQELADKGVKIIAPPLWMLVTAENGKIVPSVYAKEAKKAGLGIITWSLERSGPLATGGGWYYQTISDVVNNDGDTLTLLDVLARDVGVIGVFSDWPATATFYANCMGLK